MDRNRCVKPTECPCVTADGIIIPVGEIIFVIYHYHFELFSTHSKKKSLTHCLLSKNDLLMAKMHNYV